MSEGLPRPTEAAAALERVVHSPIADYREFLRQTMSLRIGLSMDELVELLRKDERIEFSDGGRPFPVSGRSRRAKFVAWVRGGRIVIRNQAGGRAFVLAVQDEEAGSRITGYFRGVVRAVPAPVMKWFRRLTWVGLLTWPVWLAASQGSWLGAGTFIAAFLMIALARIAAPKRRHDDHVLSETVVRLLGECLTPHQLGEGNSPFRALPPGSSR